VAEESPQERLTRLRRVNELRSKAGISPGLSAPAPQRESLLKRVAGAAEVPLSFAADTVSGIPNMAIGGARAMGDAALRTASGYGKPTERSRELVEGSRIVPTYTPKTETGKKMRGYLDKALGWVFEKPQQLANYVQDRQTQSAMARAEETGEPYKAPSALLPTAIQVAPDVAATALGMRGMRTNRGADVAQARNTAQSMGLDLNAAPEAQIKQLADQGGRVAGTGMEGLGNIPGQVAQARRTRAQRISDIFQQGKEGGATLPSRQTTNLVARVNSSLSGTTYSDLPTVQNALAKINALPERTNTNLSELMGQRNTAQTTINELMQLRMDINKDLPTDVTGREYRALSSVKKDIDGFLQEAFDKDMINGSPQALKRWKEGLSQWSDFKTLFDDDNTIRTIWQQKLTPEQVKRLILNKNAVGAKANSGSLVKSLNEILGPDSEGLQSLRMTVLDDIVRPITKRDADLNGFVENWDKFKKDNPTLASELFPPDMIKQMDDFAGFARGVDATLPADVQKRVTIPRVLSVYALGSGLARKALSVATGQRITRAIMDPDRETVILSRMLGYNPRASIIPTDPMKTLSSMETARQGAEERP